MIVRGVRPKGPTGTRHSPHTTFHSTFLSSLDAFTDTLIPSLDLSETNSIFRRSSLV